MIAWQVHEHDVAGDALDECPDSGIVVLSDNERHLSRCQDADPTRLCARTPWPTRILAPTVLSMRMRSQQALFKRHDELADVAVPGGIRDQMPIAAVLELLPSLPGAPSPNRGKRSGRVDAAQIILEWLSTHGPQYRHRADEAVTVPTIDHIRICKLDDAAVGRFSDQQQLWACGDRAGGVRMLVGGVCVPRAARRGQRKLSSGSGPATSVSPYRSARISASCRSPTLFGSAMPSRSANTAPE